MFNSTIYHADEYFLFCSAMHMSNDTWSSSVLFERKNGYGLAKSRAIRHTIIDQEFATEKDAIAAAYRFGIELVASGTVGLN